jgi:lysophospholipase L1-like esterase
MADRFNYEIIPLKPTVMTLTWGMNDTKYWEWNRPQADTLHAAVVRIAMQRYQVLDKMLKQHPEFRKVFILGSPYDETTKSNKQNYFPGKGKAFEALIDFQETVAKKNGWGYVDFDHPMLEINRLGQLKDSLFSLEPNDRIHPDNNGHMVMAYLFLKAQGLDHLPVADIAIDVIHKKTIKEINCKISDIAVKGNKVSFNYLAYSLPYPTDTIPRGAFQNKPQSDGLKLVPFNNKFNQEILKVTGLKPGTYQLSMDGQVISKWSANELSAGINLAEQMYTPEYQQALQIMLLNEERWELERRGRMYAWMEFDLLKDKGLLYADNKAAMDTVNKYSTQFFFGGNREMYTKAQYKTLRNAWEAEQTTLINAIYAANKPKMHKVQLRKVE